jgi:GT2 family glycosyltransferase
MTDLSVIIAAHDHPRLLLGALLAVARQPQQRVAEVIVVSNGSESDFARLGPLVPIPFRLVSLKERVSLGAALNRGLDEAVAPFMLLLHGNSILDLDPFGAVDYLNANVDVGIAGGYLVTPGPRPRRYRHAGYRLSHGRVGLVSIDRDEWEPASAPPAPWSVDAVSSACMLLRRTSLRVDERYWFALEDVDLCLQYRQRGYDVVMSPLLRAVHLEAASAEARRSDRQWALRELSSRFLFHDRWASAVDLVAHPLQTPVRGLAARSYLEALESL